MDRLWFRPLTRREGRLRLYCFPYAGGGTAVYRRWPELQESLDVVAVQLPGRERRLVEAPFRTVEPMVDSLAAALVAEPREPFAFFGHSLGALVAYEVARRLRAIGGPMPAHLLVSALRAPHLPRRVPELHDLPSDELREALRSYNGTPEDVLDNEELMALVEPTIRADFEAIETYRHRPEPPLSVPITVFGGTADPETTREELEAWRAHTTGAFRLYTLPGDHFFIHALEDELVHLVEQSAI